MLGMREWVRTHGHELDPRRTIFLNIDEAGYGTPRYVTSEGRHGAASDAPRLIDFCDEVREADRAGRRLGRRPAGLPSHRARRGIPPPLR